MPGPPVIWTLSKWAPVAWTMTGTPRLKWPAPFAGANTTRERKTARACALLVVVVTRCVVVVTRCVVVGCADTGGAAVDPVVACALFLLAASPPITATATSAPTTRHPSIRITVPPAPNPPSPPLRRRAELLLTVYRLRHETFGGFPLGGGFPLRGITTWALGPATKRLTAGVPAPPNWPSRANRRLRP